MPAVSQAQRRFIYGVKGKKFAEAHHFDNKGKLPSRIGKKPKKGAKAMKGKSKPKRAKKKPKKGTKKAK